MSDQPFIRQGQERKGRKAALNDELLNGLGIFQTLFDMLPIGVCIARDPACSDITINPAGAAMLGMEPDQNPSKTGPNADRLPFRILRDGVEIFDQELPMQQAARTGAPVLGEDLDIVRSDGTMVNLCMYATPLFDDGGQVRGCLGLFVDISLHRQNEQALRQNELQFRYLAETIPSFVWTAAPDGSIVYTNSRWLAYAGLNIEEQNTERWPEAVLYPDDRERCKSEWERVLREGAEYEIEVRYRRYDGVYRWFLTQALPLRDASGRIVSWFGITTDIDDRKRNEELLRRKNERLQVLTEAVEYLLTAENPDAMVLGLFERIKNHMGVDAYFSFVINETGDALKLSSCAGIPEEAVGKIDRQTFVQDHCGPVGMGAQLVVATHIQSSHDPKVRMLKALGICAYACNPLQVGNRHIGALSFASKRKYLFDDDEVEFMRTLCHYVAIAYERVHLIGELRKTDRRKDEFLATLAHELRNPLAPICNNLRILRMVSGAVPTTDKIHEVMDRQLNYLVRLVDDLLEVSRISRGAIDLRLERIELAAVIASAVEASQPLIVAAHHQLAISLPQEPVILNADPVRLEQVIANLLNNAVKYTGNGGDIWLSARCEEGEVIISVRDSGMGIHADMMPRIFDMFARADRTLKSSQDGLGIGLTLAQSLVKLHGGRIDAHSAGPGRGSEFIVRLPIVVPQIAEVRPRQGEESGRLAATSRRCILIVDDNVDAAQSLGMLLDLMGHDVQVVHSGSAALAAVRTGKVEVILLDLGMPDMTGYEVAQHLRRDPAFDRVLLVAMTGYGQEADRRRSQEAGFDRHLVKPVSADVLIKLLQSPDDAESDSTQARSAGRVASDVAL